MSVELNNQIVTLLKELCPNFREETFLANDIARGTMLGKFEVFWKHGNNQKKGLIIPSEEAVKEFKLDIFKNNFTSENAEGTEEGWCEETLVALLEYIQENYVPDFNEFVLSSLQRIELALNSGNISSNHKKLSNDMKDISSLDNQENLEHVLEVEELKKENNALQAKLWASQDQYSNLVKRVETISSKTILESDGGIKTDIHDFKELLRSYPVGLRDYE
jgi:hypothetical protein